MSLMIINASSSSSNESNDWFDILVGIQKIHHYHGRADPHYLENPDHGAPDNCPCAIMLVRNLETPHNPLINPR